MQFELCVMECPSPPFSKGGMARAAVVGVGVFPLCKRGIEGDFTASPPPHHQ